jgi:hypothetical protein
MKKFISIIILLFSLLVGFINAQSYNSSYVGINLPPLRGTEVELGYEGNLSSHLAIELFAGYLINSTIDSPTKIGTVHNFERKSGFFIKSGSRFNLRRDPANFAPFIGLHLINSLAIEKGTFNESFPGYESKAGDRFSNNAYNLGFAGMIGLTSPLSSRIGGEVGIQVGTMLIDNLIDFHSYMPGMGVNKVNGIRFTGVVRVKYKIN